MLIQTGPFVLTGDTIHVEVPKGADVVEFRDILEKLLKELGIEHDRIGESYDGATVYIYPVTP